VIVLHDVTPLTHADTFRPTYRAWARIAHGRAARRAAAVVTVSEWSAGEIERTLGIPRERIRVVRQGAAPLDHPASEAAVQDVLARFCLASRYFLAVDGADPRKGRDFLGDLWRTWPSDRPRPELVVVGGAYTQVHASDNAGPLSDFRNVGYVTDEELRALYTGSLALVFPTRAEGFGRPVLEALACGTRVVTTPYGAVSEVLDGAGEIVAPEVALWRFALQSLMDEPEAVRHERIDAGMRHASRYRWDTAVGDILAVCEGVRRR
jgi:glycosyltransferase involved in cell wall biosynthesis